MRSRSLVFACLGSLVSSSPLHVASTPTESAGQPLEARNLIGLGGIVDGLGNIIPTLHVGATPTRRAGQPSQTGSSIELGGLLDGLENLVQQPVQSVLTDLRLVAATVVPVDISAASRTLSAVIHATPTPANVVVLAGNLLAAGLTLNNVDTALNFIEDVGTPDNSFTNSNLRIPSPRAHPKVNPKDAPYSMPEAALRAAIHIPPSFQYGRPGAPQPAILVPGTGATGYLTFVGNYIPLLTGSSIADPVWLNIPGFLNNDSQVNAEYVAYAINYIYGISQRRQVAVVTWSQGGIIAQWALKYWPSTRPKVTDVVAFSPDYKGTVMASFIDINEPLPMAYLQQRYFSSFITALRSNGGDSAYVPTTTIYSGLFDEIVEPQQGANASAIMLDARHVGVSNTEVQAVCPGQPASTFYTHEGVLYNPIGFELLKDALSHPGPGQVSRINLKTTCGNYLTPGLDLTDFLLTENAILSAGLSFLLNAAKTFTEPFVRAYAHKIPA